MLLGKCGVQHPSPSPGLLLHGLLNTFRELDDRVLLRVLTEIVATTGDLRARVNPKCRFTERLHDPTQCLLLDDHIVQETKLVPIDPSIADAAPLEDDLIAALRSSGAPRAQEIIARIGDSPRSLRSTPPDYNAALVNARVARETLAADIAAPLASRVRGLAPTTRRNGAKCRRSCAQAARSHPKRKGAWPAYSDFRAREPIVPWALQRIG